MNVKEIDKKYKEICSFVVEKRLKNALDILKALIEETHLGEFNDKLFQMENTYENLLKYTLEGVDDPERKKIYDHLQVSILKLADQTKEKLLSDGSGWHTYSLKKELDKEQTLTGKIIVEKLDDLSFKHQLDDVLKEAEVLESPRESFESQKHYEVISRVFTHLWLSNNFKEAEKSLIHALLDSGKFYWYERSLCVSSITLSLLRNFDIQKFISLFEIYKLGEKEVWQRALVGLLIGFHKYNARIAHYPQLMEIIRELGETESIEKDLEQILIQLIRSGETERISRKIRDEIVPEMTKLVPKLKDKLDLDKLIPDDFLEDKNPDWGKIFEESEGLYAKVEEFSKMQLDGADVFMSAFSQLKQFSFFSEMSNWFMPFHPDNPVIDEAFDFKDAEFNKKLFLEGMDRTGYMCNSDKYSFCLNVKLMPEAQKSMLLKLFQAELNSMDELKKEEEILDSTKNSRTIYTQYIHDLYRFHKLYRFKNEFYDVFDSEMDFYNSLFFKELVKDDTILRKIAEYHFQNENFEEAIKIYLDFEGIDKDPEMLEKVAYSFQMLGDFKTALKYYKQAEIFNANKEWTQKKIALCYRNLKKPKKALEYYLRAEVLKPDNLYTQASIGHCYLELKDYEKALKYYFKVEYLNPKNTRVWRPIAWCCFVEGKFDKAAKYYSQIEAQSPNKHDFLNMGHLEWCQGNKSKAINLYKKSIEVKGNTLEDFFSSFEEDKSLLLKHGINPDDIPILLDHLLYQIGK